MIFSLELKNFYLGVLVGKIIMGPLRQNESSLYGGYASFCLTDLVSPILY